jgi:hypothetical protein
MVKISPNIWVISVIKKPPKVNNHPTGESLVTLVVSKSFLELFLKIFIGADSIFKWMDGMLVTTSFLNRN